jgi:hypothetical protein
MTLDIPALNFDSENVTLYSESSLGDGLCRRDCRKLSIKTSVQNTILDGPKLHIELSGVNLGKHRGWFKLPRECDDVFYVVVRSDKAIDPICGCGRDGLLKLLSDAGIPILWLIDRTGGHDRGVVAGEGR